MGKTIRSTYPEGFSIGLLCLVYVIVFFLSEQIFTIPYSELMDHTSVLFGMFLVANAIMIMILIIWEEFLFPIKIREINGGMVFHNHRKKLKTQIMFYCFIPVIFAFIYLEYELNLFRFAVLAAICIVLPLIEKIFSGIKNYNDFLSFTNEDIEYKDNEKTGKFQVSNIQTLTFITHIGDGTHQIELLFKSGDPVTINLHDMELEAYYDSIYKYAKSHYGSLLKEIKVD